MANANDLASLDFKIKIPHDFEVDLNSVVMLSHRFALEGIDREEDEAIRHEELSQEDYESAQNAIRLIERDYEELRNATNQLALVGVVTRFGHYIGRLAKDLPGKQEKTSDPGLIKKLVFLNIRLGDGPVPISFFQRLVDVRDSIIHRNSQARWKYGGKDTEIAACYRNPYQRVQLSKEQVQEAASKAIEQVSWYCGKLHSQVSMRASR